MKEKLTDLQKLRLLTEQLTTLPEICTKASEDVINILSANGSCRLDYIYNEQGKASICLATATAGAVIGSHFHKETEHLVMVSGEMIVYAGNQIIVLHAGNHCMFLPNTPHRAEFTTDTLLFGITIPNTEDFPNARTNC